MRGKISITFSSIDLVVMSYVRANIQGNQGLGALQHSMALAELRFSYIGAY